MNRRTIFIAFLFVLGGFFLPRAQAWQKYEDICRDDDYSPQGPPVEETVKVAGFKMVVDITQLGYAVYQPPKDGVLARLSGDDIDVLVTRVAGTSKKSIDETVAKATSGNAGVVKVLPVKSRYGLKGYRITYGGKPDWFSSHITEIRYYLINPAGETICFAARAHTKSPEWDYFKYLMTEMTGPLRV
jgi:hypothetical protein